MKHRTGAHLAIIPISALMMVLVAYLYVSGMSVKGSDAGHWLIMVSGDAFGSLVDASLAGLLVTVGRAVEDEEAL